MTGISILILTTKSIQFRLILILLLSVPRGAISTINFSALTRRRVLEIVAGEKIDYTCLSTTIAANALLGNQSRPKVRTQHRSSPPLYSTVTEVDERVTLDF
ncbi:uncharacterized protein LACBIDRAFT_301922 [Laccaria bicolor S238N-H82]|uniref:Predicted protein n=1 Tax=Laccaria bicolor (strain S238N-H82 / ATCC MYA-4686) TaxID=486041 RepID=B0CPX6_LACBS|nr:uncharacterized protein LACBIDRAFT_301922 [Laccaria bicolor S238N-H82]EDR16143.1 predicted protein [Laccaria bicolor S238N-H82]|eukprot:XP_001874351.1 predicted protein [Laccaria bicolor S238N-H82]